MYRERPAILPSSEQLLPDQPSWLPPLAMPTDTAGPAAVVWSIDVAGGADSIVLPDGCTDLIFDGTGLMIAGPDSVAFEGAPGPERPAPHTGLRVAPGIGPALWGVPGSELRNCRVPLDALWPADEVARLTERVATAAAPGRELERIVARRWRAGPPDHAMIEIAAHIGRGAPVATVAAMSGYSERQLHRKSLSAYGYGAKTLSRILRLGRALDSARSGAPLAEAAARAGYADQAHLSRDVRALTGRTLTRLLA